ncbi:MAG: hypothetical protein AAB692_00355, partial [Patescibacteria group bacterium]
GNDMDCFLAAARENRPASLRWQLQVPNPFTGGTLAIAKQLSISIVNGTRSYREAFIDRPAPAITCTYSDIAALLALLERLKTGIAPNASTSINAQGQTSYGGDYAFGTCVSETPVSAPIPAAPDSIPTPPAPPTPKESRAEPASPFSVVHTLNLARTKDGQTFLEPIAQAEVGQEFMVSTDLTYWAEDRYAAVATFESKMPNESTFTFKFALDIGSLLKGKKYRIGNIKTLSSAPGQAQIRIRVFACDVVEKTVKEQCRAGAYLAIRQDLPTTAEFTFGISIAP